MVCIQVYNYKLFFCSLYFTVYFSYFSKEYILLLHLNL